MPYATSREWLENEISDKAEYIESEGYPVVAHTLRDALALLKEQDAIIDQYRRADGFLAAHGWKWEWSLN